MFRRLIFEDYAVVFTIAAFATAVIIFVSIAWRALRMPRHQIDRLAHLPFTNDSSPPSHDSRV